MALRFHGVRSALIVRSAATGILIAFGLLAAKPSAATDATYASYMRIHGDWMVLCGLDEPTRQRRCDLKAPPPQLGLTRSEIRVAIEDKGETVISVRVGHPISPGSPVFLRVDANPPHQAQPTRTGEAEWRGEKAALILAELEGGRALVLRSFVGTPAQPRDERYSLALLSQALLDYRANTGS